MPTGFLYKMKILKPGNHIIFHSYLKIDKPGNRRTRKLDAKFMPTTRLPEKSCFGQLQVWQKLKILQTGYPKCICNIWLQCLLSIFVCNFRFKVRINETPECGRTKILVWQFSGVLFWFGHFQSFC